MFYTSLSISDPLCSTLAIAFPSTRQPLAIIIVLTQRGYPMVYHYETLKHDRQFHPQFKQSRFSISTFKRWIAPYQDHNYAKQVDYYILGWKGRLYLEQHFPMLSENWWQLPLTRKEMRSLNISLPINSSLLAQNHFYCSSVRKVFQDSRLKS